MLLGPEDHDEALLELVTRALELRDMGREDWLSAACAEQPSATESVRRAVERVSGLKALLDRSAHFDPLLGRELGGRFRLSERIGSGAMGVVYLAEDLQLGRRVACKVVRHGLMARDHALARFDREARALAAVQHPAVVAIHDRGQSDDDAVYIVMELIEGTSLAELVDVAAGQPSTLKHDSNAWLEEQLGIERAGERSYVRTVVRWIAELAAGLEVVHRAGVLHRDVKPSNILVRRDGRPALVDFGIALLEGNPGLTRGATSLGTPAYMPPEALTPSHGHAPTGDVYSLTATLYHLLTLAPPYAGTPPQILAALATREPRPAERVRAGLPRDLCAILDRGMHRSPAARYQSAAALEADLRAFLEHRPVTARPITPLARTARRLARSRAVHGALITFAVVLLWLGGQELAARRDAARALEAAQLWAVLPPNLTLYGLDNRVDRDTGDRREIERTLDRLVALGSDPVRVRTLRGAYHLDHGAVEAAAADLAVVAELVPTPFARALAARYAAVPSGQAGAHAVDVAELPPDETVEDRYLVVFHLLREGDPESAADALAALEDPSLRAIDHAEGLRLAFTVYDELEPKERRLLAAQRHEELLQLEARLGRRTATTAHIAGRALAVQGRHAEALTACEEGLALAPRAHVLRLNAGYAALGIRDLERAEEHLRIALEVRPDYLHTVENLLWVQLAGGRFDAARATLTAYGSDSAGERAEWTERWRGVIASYAALDARRRGDDVAYAVERSLAAPAEADDDSADALGALRRAVASEDGESLFRALGELLLHEPFNWWRRDLALEALPPSLSSASTELVRRLLEAR